MKTIQEIFEQTISEVWNADINTSAKINQLSILAINYKNGQFPDLYSQCIFLSRLLQKKEDMLFLELFEELNSITKKNPDLLPQLIVEEKKQHPELYKNESTLPILSSKTDNQTFKNVGSDVEKIHKDKTCLDCFWLKNDPIVCNDCISYNQFNLTFLPPIEKEQGRELRSVKQKNTYQKSFDGLTGSLSHLFESIDVYHIEIKGID